MYSISKMSITITKQLRISRKSVPQCTCYVCRCHHQF